MTPALLNQPTNQCELCFTQFDTSRMPICRKMVQKRGQPASKNKYIALPNEHKLYNTVHGITAKYQLLNYILHSVQF